MSSSTISKEQILAIEQCTALQKKRKKRKAKLVQPTHNHSYQLSASQRKGCDAEDQAKELLCAAGLRFLYQNYRLFCYEIDLIMLENESVLIFIEVRSRASAHFGSAADSITYRKQRKIQHAAQLFLQRMQWSYPCRFDAVVIDNGKIDWIKDAFLINSCDN